MKGPSEDWLLVDFILHDMGEDDPNILMRIRISWVRIKYKGKKDLGKRNCVAKEPYHKLVKEKEHQRKLSFIKKHIVSDKQK